eukprot:SAG22_NODE_49_length_24620_cov_80.053587_13_plen_79_part_00
MRRAATGRRGGAPYLPADQTGRGLARALGPKPAGRPLLMPRLWPRPLASNMAAAAAAQQYGAAARGYCWAVWTAIDKQ